MSRIEQNKKLYKRAYGEIQASSELKERLFDMKFTQKNHTEQRRTCIAIRIAAVVAVIALLGCTTVYAAGQGLFSTLFGDSDMSPVTEYIETVDEYNGGVYQAENDEWLVTVEQFLY